MDNKVNVVAGMVDNKVNVVATMMNRIENNVGLVADKDGSKTRNILEANQTKSSFLIPVDSLQKQSEKATYIVRLPEKGEVERLKEEFMQVEEDVDDPMAQPEEEEEEKEKEDFSETGVVFDASAEEHRCPFARSGGERGAALVRVRHGGRHALLRQVVQGRQ